MKVAQPWYTLEWLPDARTQTYRGRPNGRIALFNKADNLTS
jgi:hypothetical protein